MPMKNSSMTLPVLPEDIQRIILLSLPPKAFARSSVLSKSWLSFYNSTHCSFDFTFDFTLDYDRDRVHEELTKKIMNFDKSLTANLLREKLTVEEFNINIRHHSPELSDIAYKWLSALFTTNNIVKVLRIQILILTSPAIGDFNTPPEIFYNESLQVLHLQDCILDGVYPRNLGCLRVLSLYDVRIDGKSMTMLLAACPILEQLTWRNYFRVQHIIIKGLHKLKDLEIYGYADVRIQEAPSLENVSLTADNDDDQIIINSQLCRRIKHLKMFVNSERSAMHIQQIVSRLPALENLDLSMRATDIRISSGCLKNLKLYICDDQDLNMVKINAPNLRCYQCKSDLTPFSQHLMMKTGMLEMVMIYLRIEISNSSQVLELRKSLRMIEHLKLGVDTVKQLYDEDYVYVEASRLDEKSNVSATRVIEMLDAKLDAGAVMFDVDGKFCF